MPLLFRLEYDGFGAGAQDEYRAVTELRDVEDGLGVGDERGVKKCPGSGRRAKPFVGGGLGLFIGRLKVPLGVGFGAGAG